MSDRDIPIRKLTRIVKRLS